MYKSFGWTAKVPLSSSNMQQMFDNDAENDIYATHHYGYNFQLVEITSSDDFISEDRDSTDIDVFSPFIISQRIELYSTNKDDWWEFGVMIPKIALKGEVTSGDDEGYSGHSIAVGLYQSVDIDSDVQLAKLRATPLPIIPPSTVNIQPPGYTICGEDIFQFQNTGKKEVYIMLNAGKKGRIYEVVCSKNAPIQFYIMNLGEVWS